MRRIWFCIVSCGGWNEVEPTLRSLTENLQRYKHRDCGLMLLDKSSEGVILAGLNASGILNAFGEFVGLGWTEIEALERTYSEVMASADVDLSQDSIQRARIQLLLATKSRWEAVKDCILWQLDDDLLFQYDTPGMGAFPDVVGQMLSFHEANPQVAAATGTVFGVPPLPVLSYLGKNLQDLLGGRVKGELEPAHDPSFYHDLYPDSAMPAIGQTLEDEAVEDNLRRILSGDSVFRPISNVAFAPAEPWHRGGNFILFEARAAIALPHLALRYRGWVARRSDMVHAQMLQAIGFRLEGISLSLWHCREKLGLNLERIGSDYLRDVLGAVTVRYIQSPTAAWNRLFEHRQHVERLLNLTALTNREFCSPIGISLMTMLEGVDEELSQWAPGELDQHLRLFLERRALLIRQACNGSPYSV